MKIFDCFTYYNEEEILKLRLEELGDVVDYFVIIEASETFTGNSKPFYFDSIPHWIKKWFPKILRFKVDFPITCNNPWEREYFQRNSISKALSYVEILEDDLIIISDADEIWNYKAIQDLNHKDTPVRLDVKQYFWNFNWQAPQHCNQGARPIVCKLKDLKSNSPQSLRSADLKLVPNGGWHFSFFGEKEKIKNKIESFAHTEYDKEEYKDYESILNRIENGLDPFDRFPLKYYDIDDTYPSSLFKNK